jgi:hypothetical protein
MANVAQGEQCQYQNQNSKNYMMIHKFCFKEQKIIKDSGDSYCVLKLIVYLLFIPNFVKFRETFGRCLCIKF